MKCFLLNLSKKNLRVVRKTSNLPSWWVAGVHDKALLEGVAKHGLDFEEISSDPDLPFLKIYYDILEKKKDKGQKKSEHELKSIEKEILEDKMDVEEKEKNEGSDPEIKKKKKEKKSKERSKIEVIKFPKDKACLKRIQSLVDVVIYSKKRSSEIERGQTLLKISKDPPQDFLEENIEKTNFNSKKKDLAEEKNKKQKENNEGEKVVKKKKKTEKVTSAKKYVPVAVDENNNVKFPVVISNSLSIHNLGKIVYEKPGFHSSSYIWPVGYKSVRQFASMRDPEIRINYINEILDGEQPTFRVTPEDEPEKPVCASSPTAAWKIIIEKVNSMKTTKTGKRMFSAVSGPEYFGFASPAIAKLIQELPNAEKCAIYKKKQFVNSSSCSTTDYTTMAESVSLSTVEKIDEMSIDSTIRSQTRNFVIPEINMQSNGLNNPQLKLSPIKPQNKSNFGTLDIYFTKSLPPLTFPKSEQQKNEVIFIDDQPDNTSN